MDYIKYIANIITEDPNLFNENVTANPNKNAAAITNAINTLTAAVKSAMADQNMDQQSKTAIGELNNKIMPLLSKVNAALQNASKTTAQPKQQPQQQQTQQQQPQQQPTTSQAQPTQPAQQPAQGAAQGQTPQ